MTLSIPEFGSREPGAIYVLRPGGYVVALNRFDELAVVKTPTGIYLPGGGQERCESSEAAAIRESLEECGLRVTLVGRIGVADEYVFSAHEQVYYRKRCTFFRASAVEAGLGTERAHTLSWLAPGPASALLTHCSQRWAVAKSCALREPTNQAG